MKEINMVKKIGEKIEEGRRMKIGERREDEESEERRLIDRVGLNEKRLNIDIYKKKI